MDEEIFRDKSIENLESAEILFESKKYNACINRCYYAMFQITIALLKKEFSDQTGDISKGTGSHTLVISTFVKNYCNNRKIFPEYKSTLDETLINREIADYGITTFNKKKTKRVLSKTKEFVTSLNNRFEELK